MSFNDLSPSEIGERLRIARESANLTQDKAASAVHIARTTLVAIEQGRRPVRMDEFQQLAKIYGTNANSLLRREAVHVDLVPRFRKMPGADDESMQAASKLLTDLAKAEVELENILGIKRVVNYPPERPILPGNVVAQAEHDAQELRQRLGLALQPVQDVTVLLELEMGIRVYVRKLDARISGLFAYDEQLGVCVLLNANHPRERRNQSALHELGHVVSTRGVPDVLHVDSPERSPEEKYANAFARAFLTPPRAVIQKLRELTAGASRLTRRHVIELAHIFGVSREAMVRRLEELEQTKPGTWDWFEANGRITDEQVRQVLGDRMPADHEKGDANRATTIRLGNLACEVWRLQLMSEGQLTRLLNLDRVELRELLTDVEADGEAGDEAPVLLR